MDWLYNSKGKQQIKHSPALLLPIPHVPTTILWLALPVLWFHWWAVSGSLKKQQRQKSKVFLPSISSWICLSQKQSHPDLCYKGRPNIWRSGKADTPFTQLNGWALMSNHTVFKRCWGPALQEQENLKKFFHLCAPKMEGYKKATQPLCKHRPQMH